jgi:hypothetical protein
MRLVFRYKRLYANRMALGGNFRIMRMESIEVGKKGRGVYIVVVGHSIGQFG